MGSGDSSRSPTCSRPRRCMRRFEVYERRPVQEWTASPPRSTKRTPGEISVSRRAQRWKVPSTATAQGLYPQGKRETETDLDSRFGGQDRAKGNGRGTECHLRAGFSQLLLRV